MSFTRAGISLLAAGILAAPVTASDTMQVTPATPTDIALGGQVLMRMRTAEGGYSPRERADWMRTRLIPILSMENIKPHDVEVRQTASGDHAAIFVRNRLLVTIGERLAQANDSTPVALAHTWANRLRGVLPQVAANQYTRNRLDRSAMRGRTESVSAARETTSAGADAGNGWSYNIVRMTTDGTTFNPDRITAYPGQRVEVTFVNNGTSPQNVSFALPGGEMVFNPVLAPGEARTISFVVPDEPGDYRFNNPAMSGGASGMRGTLVVVPR